MGTTLAQLLSGFMAYEYRCAGLEGAEEIDSTLNEWAAAGWDLHTATTAMSEGKIYHYLYFRQERIH
jgi:hypothetical protein